MKSKSVQSLVLVHQRLLERDLNLKVDKDALDYLAEVGYDPVYGARPLKRAVQNYLENPLAQDILAGKFLPGQTIDVTREKDHLIFKSKK